MALRTLTLRSTTHVDNLWWYFLPSQWISYKIIKNQDTHVAGRKVDLNAHISLWLGFCSNSCASQSILDRKLDGIPSSQHKCSPFYHDFEFLGTVQGSSTKLERWFVSLVWINVGPSLNLEGDDSYFPLGRWRLILILIFMVYLLWDLPSRFPIQEEKWNFDSIFRLEGSVSNPLTGRAKSQQRSSPEGDSRWNQTIHPTPPKKRRNPTTPVFFLWQTHPNFTKRNLIS